MSRLRNMRKQRMKKSLALRMVDGGSLLLTVSGGKPVIKFCTRSVKKKELKKLALEGSSLRFINAGNKKLIKILNS